MSSGATAARGLRAMVTGASTSAGRSVIDQLRARGIQVVAVDAEVDAGAQPQVVETVPPASDSDRLTVLRRLAVRHAATLLIPTIDDELPQLAAARSGFGPDTEVVVAGAGPVSIAHDRLYTAWQLRERAVPVPSFGPAGDFAGVHSAFEALGTPLLAVPRVRREEHESFLLEVNDGHAWSRLGADHLVQRVVPGERYVCSVYRPQPGRGVDQLVVVLEHGTSADGQPVVRRLGDGEGQDVARVGLAAVRALGLVGPVDVDVRRDVDGQPFVLEVRARFGEHSELVPELLTRVLLAATSGPRSR